MSNYRAMSFLNAILIHLRGLVSLPFISQKCNIMPPCHSMVISYPRIGIISVHLIAAFISDVKKKEMGLTDCASEMMFLS